MNQAPPQAKGRFLFRMLCCAGGFAILSSTMSKTPVLPLFAESLGASPEAVGLIAAVATVVGILTSAPAGFLSDYIGRRKVILAAGLVFASAPFLYCWVRVPWQLAALRLYHGLATAIFGPVALALVADMFSSNRAEKMGTYSSATLVGRFLAPLLGGFLIFRLGYKAVYMSCGVFGSMAFLLLFLLPKNPGEGDALAVRKFSSRELLQQLKGLFGNVPMVAASACEAAIYFAFGAVETFFPLYAIKIGMNAQQIGILFSAQILTIALTKPLMGRLSDSRGRRGSIIAGLMLGSISVAFVTLTRNFFITGLVLVAFGMAMATVTASTAAMVADLSRKRAYGSSMGLLSSIMDVGHASGPILAGVFVAAWGYEANFLIVAGLLLIAAFLFPFFVRRTVFVSRSA